MVEISSIKNPKIKDIANLYDKKERNDKGKFIVEGYHLVEEAVKSGVLEFIVTTNKNDFDDYQTDGFLVNDQVIKKISTTCNCQGILGVCSIKNYSDFEINDIVKNHKSFILLDNINDPGNFGTIIRTAASFGIDAIFTSYDTVDLYNDKVIRATQGAIFKIPVIKSDLKRIIRNMKENGIYVLGTSLKAKTYLHELNIDGGFAAVFGNEANGVRREIQELVDLNYMIPMKNDMESLNVAIACGISIYYLTK